MNKLTTTLDTLQSGTICNVLIRGQQRIRRRVFKWREQRFTDIPCFVFSAPVAQNVRATYHEESKRLTISGHPIPLSEVSVPRYDVLLCEPIRNLAPLNHTAHSTRDVPT